MSVPEYATATATRREGPLRRAIGVVVAHPIIFGVIFLLLCGWKLTFRLDHVLDLDADHETMYIAYMLGVYGNGHVPPEYSPLYVAWYAFEHWFASDPIRLYYVNITALTLGLPISFFIYLAIRRVPVVLALPSALYLMIARADLPTFPKMMHFCLIVAFLGLAVFVRLGGRPARWGFLLVLCAMLSLIRPELIYLLVAVAGWSAYRLVVEQGKAELAAGLALGAAAAGGLYWAFGVPLFGQRSVLAFAWHFAANYMTWHGRSGDAAFTGDFWGIYHAVFGDAQSIPAAFFANPGAFLHHVLSNLVHAPTVIAGRFLSHYNLLLPQQRAMIAIEGALFGLVLAVVAAVWARRQSWGWLAPAGGAASVTGSTGLWLRHMVRDHPDLVFLLLLAAPYPVMILVLYPRDHYVVMAGTSLAAIGLVLVGERWRPPSPLNPRLLLALPLLLGLVPSLAGEGADLDRPYDRRDAVVGPRPTLAEVRFLRRLDITRPVNVLEASDPGICPYVGPDCHSVQHDLGERSLGPGALFRRHDFSIVVEDDRLRAFNALRSDPEWVRFLADPQQFGFVARPVPDSDVIIYLKRDLAKQAPLQNR